MKNKHKGSNFDDFLEEEGLLEETEAVTIKRVIAFELEKTIKAKHVSKSKLALRMHTSRSALDRVFDPDNTSITLKTCTCSVNPWVN